MADSKAVRAGKAFVELFADDSLLQRGLDVAARKLAVWGAAISRTGLALAASGVARLAPVIAATLNFGQVGNHLHELSAATGETVENLSALGYVAERCGGSIDTIAQAFETLNGFMLEGVRGSEHVRTTITELGISFQELRNSTASQRFDMLADALARIPGPILRGHLAMQLFGSAGRTLLPVLRDGAAGIEALRQQAVALGVVLTGEDAAAARSFTQGLRDLKAQAVAFAVQIGAAFVPAIQGVIDWLRAALPPLIAWIKENKTLVVTLFAGAAADVALGLAMVVLGVALKAASLLLLPFKLAIMGLNLVMLVVTGVTWLFTASIAALGSVLGGVALAVGILVAIGAGVGMIWIALTRVDWAEVIGAIGSAFTSTWGGIADAIEAGRMDLAFEVVTSSIKLVWLRFFAWLDMQWRGTLRNMQTFVGGIANLLERLADPLGLAGRPLAQRVEERNDERLREDMAAAGEHGRALANAEAARNAALEAAHQAVVDRRAREAPGGGGPGGIDSLEGVRGRLSVSGTFSAQGASALAGATDWDAITARNTTRGNELAAQQLAALLQMRDSVRAWANW